MATAKPAEGEVPAGGGKKKLIIIVAAVVVLALGGGTAFFLSGAGEADAANPDAAAAAPKKEPIYIALNPAFVVNFQDRNERTKFLKAELNVVTHDDDVADAIEKHMPVIRNNLILLFSRQLYEDLVPHEGKEALRTEALTQVQNVLEQQTGAPGVEDLFFTSFVMQ